MNSVSAFLLFAAGLLGLALDGAAVAADTVTMANGDKLSGKVLRREGDTLKFETAYAGTVAIDWTQIRKVDLEQPGRVLLEDESVREVSQLVRGRVPGALSQASVDVSEVRLIHPQPWELGKAGKFSGEVNLAGEFENGSADSDEVDLDFRLGYRFDPHRYGLLGQLEYDRANGVLAKQEWFVMQKYDHFIDDHWYGSLTHGIQQQKLGGLDLRQFGGPSLGYQVASGKPLELRGELGIFFVDEHFDTKPSESYVGPSFSLNYEQFILEQRLRLYHRHVAMLDAGDVDKHAWRSWTGFSVPLGGGVQVGLEYELDYESQPAIQAEPLDHIMQLKVGWSW